MKVKNILIVFTLLNMLASPLLVKAAHIPDASPHQRHAVSFSFSGITGLSPSHLEAWAVNDEDRSSIGKFTVDTAGVIRDLSGNNKNTFSVLFDLALADGFEVTIEPQGDNDDVPSGIVLLSGTIVGNSSVLSFPVDFSASSGTYILATPSNGADTNENSGIWFLQLPEPPTAGLELPALPSGWVYEGWVVHDDVHITSGRFTSASGFDDFDDYSASSNYPPFPGEDFLQNAPAGLSFPIDLDDGTSRAIISVEPDIAGSDPTEGDMFAIRPLVGTIPGGAADHINYEMNQNLSMPSGLAVVTILTIPEGPPPDDDDVPSLEERITELEQTNTELEAARTLLEEAAADLQDRVESLTDSVGLWQLLSGVALILGAVVGYFVMRFHG